MPGPVSRNRSCIPQVNGIGSVWGSGGDEPPTENDDTTHQSGAYGFQALLGTRPVWKDPARAGGRDRSGVGERAGSARLLVTLVGDVVTNYFLLRELDLQLTIARQTLNLNDVTVTYFQNRFDGGVSNRLELDRIQALRARPLRQSRPSNSDRPGREPSCAAARVSRLLPSRATRRPSMNACRRRFPPVFPPRFSSGGPTSSRQSSARRGQRRHRRGEIAVLSHDQPDGVSGRRERRSDHVSRREWSALVAEPWAFPADLSGGADPPEPRGGAGAIRRGARRIPEGRAQRLPRGGQLPW